MLCQIIYDHAQSLEFNLALLVVARIIDSIILILQLIYDVIKPPNGIIETHIYRDLVTKNLTIIMYPPTKLP